MTSSGPGQETSPVLFVSVDPAVTSGLVHVGIFTFFPMVDVFLLFPSGTAGEGTCWPSPGVEGGEAASCGSG